MRIVSASARVHNLYPLRLASGNLQILQAHSPEECPALLLKPVLVIPPTPVFSSRSSAWLASCHYARALRTQHVCQLLDLRALAAAVKPFEAYEPPLA